MSVSLRKSDHTEKPMQASKWLSVALLIDAVEMEELFAALGEFYIFFISCITDEGKGEISKTAFLKKYSDYILDLKKGLIPDEKEYRHFFSSVFTISPENVYAITLEDDQQLIRVAKPVVQLQAHKIGYSHADEKFRSRTFGSDTLCWGIQFSFPQLYQDNKTHEIFQVKGSDFPNSELFHKIQKWVRHHTAPTPFIVNGKQVNVPMRLGKKCFDWIHQHPQLIEKNIYVGKADPTVLH